MTLAAVLRILAAIFSKGYGMHDDHFLIIEVAQQWLEGIPHWFELGKPSLHSLLYPGLHYYLFSFLENIGLTDPQGKMYVVRILHGIYSLLTVFFGYKLTKQISDKPTAATAGLILAIFWYFPFLSVRNLREITCIPPLIMAFYYFNLSREKGAFKLFVLSAVLFAIAFTFRFQTLFFPAGLGMALLLKKEWKRTLYLAGFFLLTVFLIQGITDWVAWGYPFASLHAYYLYNNQHANDFITAPWFQHILTLLGFMGPPFSLLFIWGFLCCWKKQSELFWPVALFLFFHSIFPNKQERFIFPILPFLIILGVVGWNEYFERSDFWQKRWKLVRGSWRYFWIINTVFLLLFTFYYSKKSRVEAMYYLNKQADFQYALLESYRGRVPFPPLFYLDKWHNVYEKGAKTNMRRLTRMIKDRGNHQPNYIVFFGDKDLDKRIAEIKNLYPKMTYKTTIETSVLDQILFKLNPKHQANETAYIYKVPVFTDKQY